MKQQDILFLIGQAIYLNSSGAADEQKRHQSPELGFSWVLIAKSSPLFDPFIGS